MATLIMVASHGLLRLWLPYCRCLYVVFVRWNVHVLSERNLLFVFSCSYLNVGMWMWLPLFYFDNHSLEYIDLCMLQEIKMLLAWDSEIPTLYVHIDLFLVYASRFTDDIRCAASPSHWWKGSSSASSTVYPSHLPWSSETVNAHWIPMRGNMPSDKRFLPWTPPDDLNDLYVPIVYSVSHYVLWYNYRCF